MDTPPPATPIKRRLTAILAADAVGFSRQMGADEEGTLRVLAAQRAIIDRIIAAHDGRIVGTAGDSVLAEFASSVEAVRCAVEMQEALQTRNETLPESERLVFRVGVNLGDVMVDGANILGDGVNVAARLEGIAEPGGICISSSVYDQIAGKLSLGFLDIGEQSLKNISRPIRVYRLDRTGAVGVGVARQKPAAGRGRWLAAGGVAVVAVAALGAWQSGMLQRAPSPPGGGSLAIMPVPPTPPERRPAPPSEETRMKLQIAEAERAKAEAELAKARAEAETARLRTQTARAPVADTKDAKSTVAATPASPAAAPASAPAPAAAVAKPAPGATMQPPAIVASAAPSAPASASAATVTATRRCGPFEELRPFTDELPAFIADGDIVIERGLPDAPGHLSLRGRPSADGKLVMSGTLVSVAQRTKGNHTSARFEGSYAEDHYTLVGHQGKRVCTIVVYAAPPR